MRFQTVRHLVKIQKKNTYVEPHVHVKIKGSHTSTQVEHQPASDKEQRIAACRLLKVQLSCSEEFAESAGPYRDQGSLC